jgi:hypothetical protein
MRLTFRIVRVDFDGYNGRDLHPTKKDEGTTVTLVSAQTYSYETSRLVVAGTALSDEWETTLTCMRPDGTLVEMMPHEVVFHVVE